MTPTEVPSFQPDAAINARRRAYFRKHGINGLRHARSTQPWKMPLDMPPLRRNSCGVCRERVSQDVIDRDKTVADQYAVGPDNASGDGPVRQYCGWCFATLSLFSLSSPGFNPFTK